MSISASEIPHPTKVGKRLTRLSHLLEHAVSHLTTERRNASLQQVKKGSSYERAGPKSISMLSPYTAFASNADSYRIHNMDWKDYQETSAQFFRDLGLEVSIGVRLNGVRTTHDIDVLVRSHHMGFDITWIVECKYWKTRVSKLHVLALREIVADLGADRGILLSESGFQSGAHEAAALTNVQLTSLGDMQNTAKIDIYSMRIRELYDFAIELKERYWRIPKHIRIRVGLRPPSGGYGYSANIVLDLANKYLSRAVRGVYPIEVDPFERFALPDQPEILESHEAVIRCLEPALSRAHLLIEEAEQLG